MEADFYHLSHQESSNWQFFFLIVKNRLFKVVNHVGKKKKSDSSYK